MHSRTFTDLLLYCSVAMTMGICTFPISAFAQQESSLPSVEYFSLHLSRASCDELLQQSLVDRVSIARIATRLQQRDILPYITGSTCALLGDIEVIALLERSSLTVNPVQEALLYSPEAHILLVTNRARNGLAYSMVLDASDTNPLEYFLNHEREAEFAATVARTSLPYSDPSSESKEFAFSSRPSVFVTPASSAYSRSTASQPTNIQQPPTSLTTSGILITVVEESGASLPIIQEVSLTHYRNDDDSFAPSSHLLTSLLLSLAGILLGSTLYLLYKRRHATYLEEAEARMNDINHVE